MAAAFFLFSFSFSLMSCSLDLEPSSRSLFNSIKSKSTASYLMSSLRRVRLTVAFLTGAVWSAGVAVVLFALVWLVAFSVEGGTEVVVSGAGVVDSVFG